MGGGGGADAATCHHVRGSPIYGNLRIWTLPKMGAVQSEIYIRSFESGTHKRFLEQACRTVLT